MIIAFCGYAGAGKSTAAEYLAKEYGFKRVNFKDGLVAEIKERFPDVLDEICESFNDLCPDFDTLEPWTRDSLFVEKPPLMRALMRNYGTEVRRADNPNYWVDQWKAKVEEVGGNIVVDDVRFFNELAAVGDADGILIRVTRPDITTGGTHLSETEQEKFVEDFTIVGEPGDHAAIYKQVDEIINTLKTNVD